MLEFMSIISLFMDGSLRAQWDLHSDLCNEWMHGWMALCDLVSYVACCNAAISFSETVHCFGESAVQIAQSLYIPMYCLTFLLWIQAAEALTPVMLHLIKYCQIFLISLASLPSQPMCHCLGEFDLKHFQSVCSRASFDTDMDGSHTAISNGGRKYPIIKWLNSYVYPLTHTTQSCMFHSVGNWGPW